MLCNALPTLFNLVAHKNARVADVWDASKEEGRWSLVFLRSFNDWEVEEVERSLQYLHNNKIRPFQEDQMLVNDSKTNGFSVRLMDWMLDHSPPIAFPFRSIWNPFVSPQIEFFLPGKRLGARYSCSIG